MLINPTMTAWWPHSARGPGLVSLSQTAALRLRLDPVAELVPMATADPVPA